MILCPRSHTLKFITAFKLMLHFPLTFPSQSLSTARILRQVVPSSCGGSSGGFDSRTFCWTFLLLHCSLKSSIQTQFVPFLRCRDRTFTSSVSSLGLLPSSFPFSMIGIFPSKSLACPIPFWHLLHRRS